MAITMITFPFYRNVYYRVGISIFVLLQTAVKNIPLSNAEISETDVDKKDHAFRIKPKDNGRTFYIQAENENVQNDWMQAICFAKAAGHHGDNSQACTIQ